MLPRKATHLYMAWLNPEIPTVLHHVSFNAAAQILSVKTGKSVFPDFPVCWSSESTRFAAKEQCISVKRSAWKQQKICVKRRSAGGVAAR